MQICCIIVVNRLCSRLIPMPPASSSSLTSWSSSKVRQTFVNYFVKEHGHVFVPSSPTIPLDDPTLLFANSGMAQFKAIFQGTVDPNSSFARLKRAVNFQKCIRAGGKHNDLDDVGKDTYHHTFFEMLGNWSFGDYFKKEAISMAWHLLTRVFNLEPSRLYVTYFEGNAELGIPEDQEAKDIWLAQGVDPAHLLPFGMKENFWEMGESGPCGPCSEIHYDRIGNRNAASLVNKDDPMVIEIWNLVFMQFNRELDRSLRPLPNQHVDTGMGFERLVSILQNKSSNYDTDVFEDIFEAIRQGCNIRPYMKQTDNEDTIVNQDIDIAYRVVADHIRTLSIAISDGGSPSNDGRGYVLRRILRRAIRYAHEKLSAPPGFLATLVPVVANSSLGEAFPELYSCISKIQDIINDEETQFRKTLDKGLLQFSKFIKTVKETNTSILDGQFAWKLYDTFGFPLDLTILMAEEQGIKVDQQGYQDAQTLARQISKGATTFDNDKSVDSRIFSFALDVHKLEELSKANIPGTVDDFKYSHVPKKLASTLVAIYDLLNNETGDLPLFTLTSGNAAHPCALIFNQTNMYAEAGGQVGDSGVVFKEHDGEILCHVKDVRRYGSYVVHLGLLVPGVSINSGSTYELAYDPEKRMALRRNHTGTHLLNWAISSIIGTSSRTTGGDQKGSLVAPDRLRFDYGAPIPSFTTEEFLEIESKINTLIQDNILVSTRIIPLNEARLIPNLRAVFGEIYPDPVRVVEIGSEASIELCGGTHVEKTGDIEDFVIVQDSLIAKGIRRIVALTGSDAISARSLVKDFDAQLLSLDLSDPGAISTLKNLAKQIDDVDLPIAEKSRLKASLAASRKKWDDGDKSRRASLLQSLVKELETSLSIDSVTFVVKVMECIDAKILSSVIAPSKSKSIPTLLLSYDPNTSLVSLISYVPKHIGVSPVSWLEHIGPLVSAKFGAGKGEVAQGTGSADSLQILDRVIAEASDFAKRSFN